MIFKPPLCVLLCLLRKINLRFFFFKSRGRGAEVGWEGVVGGNELRFFTSIFARSHSLAKLPAPSNSKQIEDLIIGYHNLRRDVITRSIHTYTAQDLVCILRLLFRVIIV